MGKTNAQVAHLWAQGKSLYAKSDNMSCADNKLYSYSTCIGFIHGKSFFLSQDTMSMTTANHLSHAYRATGYRNVLFTKAFWRGRYSAPSVKDCIETAIADLKKDYEALNKRKALMSAYIDRYCEQRDIIIQTAKRCKIPYGKLPVVTAEMREKAQEYLNRREGKMRLLEEKRNKELEAQRALDKADFETWLNNGEGLFPRSYYRHENTDYITVRDDKVITSQSAEAPLSHVRKAIAFYMMRQENGSFDPWEKNGHSVPLGHFALDRIDSEGYAFAGCHKFSRAEIGRFIDRWIMQTVKA